MQAPRKLANTVNKLLSALLVVAALCTNFATVNAAALYKWVDENGQIRYSDRLPPSQVKKKHQQLNSQGVVLTTKEAAKSEEELAAEAEAKRKQEEEDARLAKEQEAQFKKDQVLLLTFSNEEELGLARDNRIEVLESVIQLIENSLITTQEQLNRLVDTAEQNYTSQGKEVPGGLAQKIEHFTRKMENRKAQRDLKIEEKQRINDQYQLDLARYRDLKSSEGTEPESSSN